MQRSRVELWGARAGIALVALVVALSAGCMNPGQDQVMQAMNADRAAHGLPALTENPVATRVAQAWALQLSKDGKLSHTVLPDQFRSITWCYLGENVGYGPTVEVVEDAYMKSPHHRANILDPRWTSVGVGYRVKDGRTYTVQEFVGTC